MTGASSQPILAKLRPMGRARPGAVGLSEEATDYDDDDDNDADDNDTDDTDYYSLAERGRAQAHVPSEAELGWAK